MRALSFNPFAVCQQIICTKANNNKKAATYYRICYACMYVYACGYVYVHTYVASNCHNILLSPPLAPRHRRKRLVST